MAEVQTQEINMLVKDLEERGFHATYIAVRKNVEIIIHIPPDAKMPVYTGFTGVIEYGDVHMDFSLKTLNFNVIANGVYEFKDVIPYYDEEDNVLRVFFINGVSEVAIYDTNKIINALLTMLSPIREH